MSELHHRVFKKIREPTTVMGNCVLTKLVLLRVCEKTQEMQQFMPMKSNATNRQQTDE